MKTKNLTEETARPREPNDPWQGYVDWKSLRAEGFTHVQIADRIYEFDKWGPLGYP